MNLLLIVGFAEPLRDYIEKIVHGLLIIAIMKVIIAGSRDFDDYNLLYKNCNNILSNQKEIEIVSGRARGADKLGEKYAKEKSLKLKLFPANWEKYGKKAGYLRNEEMAGYAKFLIVFWDGVSKGTKNMINIAKEKGLEIRIIKY